MTDDTTPPVEDLDRQAPPVTQTSIVDAFRAAQHELESEKEVYIAVKGYESVGLMARYHLPESGKLLDGIVRKVNSETKDPYYRNLNATMDVMAHLSDGLYVGNPDYVEGGEQPQYLAFDPITTGSPVGFDADLADVLGLEVETPTARAIIKKLFGNRDIYVLNHAEKLQRWINDTNADVTSELWQLELPNS